MGWSKLHLRNQDPRTQCQKLLPIKCMVEKMNSNLLFRMVPRTFLKTLKCGLGFFKCLIVSSQ